MLGIADVAVALWPKARPSEAGERARQVLEARGVALAYVGGDEGRGGRVSEGA